MNNPEMIRLTVRSFIPPGIKIDGYSLGVPFPMQVRKGITLHELSQMILCKNINLLGVQAVNGLLASKDTVLADGDRVDLFAAIDGG
jgi:hypothetical protein